MAPQFLQQYSCTQLIDSCLCLQALFSISFFISALFELSNSYAGFITIILALFFLLFILATYYMIRTRALNRTFYGINLSMSLFLVFIALQTAIYWGQYSGCDTKNQPSYINYKFGPECYNPSAMTSLCVFSVFLLLTYIFQLFLLLRFKDDILGSDQLNESKAYSPINLSEISTVYFNPINSMSTAASSAVSEPLNPR